MNTSRGGVRYFPKTSIPYKSKEQNQAESKRWNDAYDKEQKKASDTSKLSAWERLRYE